MQVANDAMPLALHCVGLHADHSCTEVVFAAISLTERVPVYQGTVYESVSLLYAKDLITCTVCWSAAVLSVGTGSAVLGSQRVQILPFPQCSSRCERDLPFFSRSATRFVLPAFASPLHLSLSNLHSSSHSTFSSIA